MGPAMEMVPAVLVIVKEHEQYISTGNIKRKYGNVSDQYIAS